jgi:hypothetical protein
VFGLLNPLLLAGQPPPPLMAASVGSPMPPPPPAAVMMPPPPAATAVVEEEAESSANAGGGTRNSLFDQIKGMSVDRLRNKEESSMATKKIEKKAEEERPVSLHDALKAKLSRLNKYVVSLFCLWLFIAFFSLFFLFYSAISGKTDKEQQRRDSMKIQEARMTLSAGAKSSSGGFDFDTG